MGIRATGTAARARATASSTVTGRSTSISGMARFRRLRGAGAVGLALTLWDAWQRIPPRHRKQIVKHARKHGPKLASRLLQAQARRRRPR